MSEYDPNQFLQFNHGVAICQPNVCDVFFKGYTLGYTDIPQIRSVELRGQPIGFYLIADETEQFAYVATSLELAIETHKQYAEWLESSL